MTAPIVFQQSRNLWTDKDYEALPEEVGIPAEIVNMMEFSYGEQKGQLWERALESSLLTESRNFPS